MQPDKIFIQKNHMESEHHVELNLCLSASRCKAQGTVQDQVVDVWSCHLLEIWARSNRRVRVGGVVTSSEENPSNSA